MSDEFNSDENKEEEDEDFGALTGGSGDSGLGNLPPLSDFDSADAESSPGLPPLDSQASEGDSGGELVPDLSTPMSGNQPIETPNFDTPTSGLDTPEPISGLGFQDFAADSDFSPETPDIGPGPDSDIETPMFDSAFGGDGGDFGSSGGTPAPTQAMETPMFDTGPDTPADTGGIGGMGGFGDDIGGDFGAGGGMGDDLGTPIPDFSPDTGVPQEPVTGNDADGDKKKKKKAKSGGGGGMMSKVIPAVAALVMLGVGIFVGPMIRGGGIPQEDMDKLTAELQVANSNIRKLKAELEGQKIYTPEELERIKSEVDELQVNFDRYTAELPELENKIGESRNTLRTVSGDIEEKNAEFVMAQEQLETLMQNMAITQARHDGLLSENRRLTSQVGELEEANDRQLATNATLLHSLDRLIVQVEGGSPLAPERYAHQRRLNRATTLRKKVLDSKWVSPDLLNEYTELYLSELAIASSREYFFAKIPVHDQLGTKQVRWAECLMNGNWSVYFRTIDGKHIGSYENVSDTITPRYEFREDLGGSIKGDIEGEIKASRIEGWDEKVAVLKQKQAVYETKSNLQSKYSSL